MAAPYLPPVRSGILSGQTAILEGPEKSELGFGQLALM
jgi:hypothetical protein